MSDPIDKTNSETSESEVVDEPTSTNSSTTEEKKKKEKKSTKTPKKTDSTSTTKSNPSATPPPKPPTIMSTIGTLAAFDPSKDDFEMWNGTFENFLVANSITEASRSVGIFLSSMGISTYTLLSNLLAPDAPSSKKLKDLQTVLLNHFKPAPKAIAERFKFTRRTQKPGETVNQFLAALRTLSVKCKFTADLEERIRDQLIFGLNSEPAQRRLFTKDDSISLQDVVALAIAQEAAVVSTTLVRGHTQPEASTSTEQVNKLSRFKSQQQRKFQKGTKGNPDNTRNSHQANDNPQKNRNTGNNNNKNSNNNSNPCSGCGSTQHSRSKCPHANSKCYKCGRTGHIAPVCKSSGPSSNNHLSVEPFNLNNVTTSTTRKQLLISVKINGVPHNMEFDPGCDASMLSEDFWKGELGSTPLSNSSIVYRTYTGETFTPLGQFSAKIEHNGQTITHIFPVCKGTSLFGKDFLFKFKINWEQIAKQCNHVSVSAQSELQTLLEEYNDIFQPPTSTDRIRNFKAHIILKEDATPRFLKARPVPYSQRVKVDKELSEMEATGVISKIETCDWASPLVVVPKADGRIRITGDFKMTVNSQLCVTQYPLAIPDDLFATISGGNTFSKLDGSNAYHQIEIDDASKNF